MTEYPGMCRDEMLTYARNKTNIHSDAHGNQDYNVEMRTKDHYVFTNGFARVHVQSVVVCMLIKLC